jgi:hypothetical protein
MTSGCRLAPAWPANTNGDSFLGHLWRGFRLRNVRFGSGADLSPSVGEIRSLGSASGQKQPSTRHVKPFRFAFLRNYGVYQIGDV